MLFGVTYWIDLRLQGSLTGLPFLFSGSPESSRSLLSTVSESLITVLATTFSITIVALQLASGQYSPRLLRTFMADRGVQSVLGAYIATFVYSQLTLRVTGRSGQGAEAFNPLVSVTVATVFALVCIGLFIYFIQHVATIIQSSAIVEKAHEDSVGAVERLPALDGAEEDGSRALPGGLKAGEAAVLTARRSGYVQRLDLDFLAKVVSGGMKEGGVVVVEVPCGPGRFVSAGLPLARVWPSGALEETGEGAHGAFVFGRERSFEQDFAFGLRQLSDIALKGLSPGVNDPTTAMQAMDRMEAVLIALVGRALPPRVQEREVGGVRVVFEVGVYDYDDVVGLAFDQIRRAAFTSGQVAVLERLLEILDRLARANASTHRRRALWARAFTVARLAPSQMDDPHDATNLLLRVLGIGAFLARTELRPEVVRDVKEIAELSTELPGGERVRAATAAVSAS